MIDPFYRTEGDRDERVRVAEHAYDAALNVHILHGYFNDRPGISVAYMAAERAYADALANYDHEHPPSEPPTPTEADDAPDQ